MRIMKDDDFIPLSDPQRGRFVQLLNFQRYKALEDKDGIFNDWEAYTYGDFAAFQSRHLSGSDPLLLFKGLLENQEQPRLLYLGLNCLGGGLRETLPPSLF